MEPETIDEARRAVGATRRPPGPHGLWMVGPDGTRTIHGGQEDTPPCEIWFQSDHGHCLPKSWNPPGWLDPAVHQWSELPILMGFEAAKGALPSELAWQCFRGVAGAAPGWQLVLRTDGGGVVGMPSIDRVLSGPFGEVQFVCDRTSRGDARGGERVLLMMKQLIELRQARGQERPLVAWIVKTDATGPGRDEIMRSVRSTARQLGLDRFEVVVEQTQARPPTET
ncbi:MAG: hypothetical protein JXQ73_04290 [Phycisphaerae bacterium]|nr:hypothetical protein [Phycisphaerae bacterium]